MASGKTDEYREKMAAKLTEYLSAHFEDGSTNPSSRSRGTGSVYASPQGEIGIVISFKNVNVDNYWTGGWQSEWTLNVAKTGKQKLEGRIRLNVHYYEDGNVQLNSTYNEQATVNIGVGSISSARCGPYTFLGRPHTSNVT